MIEIKIKHQICASSGDKILEIDQQITEGSFVHVSGDSGIGKTTFFKILSGLIYPDFGCIRIKEKVLMDTSNKIFLPSQKRNISMMFQNYALFPNMTVRQNITFAQKEKNELLVNELLVDFDLKNFENGSPSQLSGGQQQRVALARTLVQNADLVLLDEPISAVDSSMRELMVNKIIQYNKTTGSTFFVISHNEKDFEGFADCILKIS